MWGYAYVGDNEFIKVTCFNPLWILIPLLCILGIIFGLHFCSNSPVAPLNINKGGSSNKAFDVVKQSNVTVFNKSGEELKYTINAVAKVNISKDVKIEDVIAEGNYKYNNDIKVTINNKDITKSCTFEKQDNGYKIVLSKPNIKVKDTVKITYSGKAYKTDPIVNEVKFKTAGYSPSKASCTVAPPNVTYVPFAQNITLTKDNKNMTLTNDKDNTGNYYVSYALAVDGKPIKTKDGKAYETGLIGPNREVEYNLYDNLKAGTYEFTALSTCYDYSTIKELQENKNKYSAKEYQELFNKAKKPVTHTLKTTVKVKK